VSTRRTTLALTALAPAIWGTTYIVTTEWLPAGYPLTVSLLRALPAGLLLLAIVRVLPRGIWWGRVLLLGAFNFAIFWSLLFEAAYRLPGGVAATVGAVQPMIVLMLARFWIGAPLRAMAMLAALGGVIGVSLLVLRPGAAFDAVGIAAALGSAASMAVGTVLTKRWQPPVSALTFTAWQLVAGGVLLLIPALILEPGLPALSTTNLIGFAWLGLVGAALTYILWFRGIAALGPASVAPLGFLSPMTAALLGWLVLGQELALQQIAGIVLVLVSVWLSQRAQATKIAAAGDRVKVMRSSDGE
jgi:probable blue pigment (indigoidine) exporter